MGMVRRRAVLPNSDERKWDYPPHTRAKHAILIRYMKAWLPILGTLSKQLVIVDAFAGRGRYTTDDAGSPLLLRDVVGRVASDQRVDKVELFYIENDAANFAALSQELAHAERLPGVVERGPFHNEFERAAPAIVEAVRQFRHPSFWFIDPFGFAGLPLTLINGILRLPRSEVLVTLMVRDINRFLDEPNHQQADAHLFGLRGDELLTEIDRVKTTSTRTQALRDLYVERLEATVNSGQARYVSSVGVTERGASDIIYYLIHATSHPKGKREMKEAVWEATGGLSAVVGARLAAETLGQVDMFSGVEMREMMVNYAELKNLLQKQFAGQAIEYDALQNRAVVDHTYDAFIDNHIKRALEDLAVQGVKRFRDRMPSTRALRRGDIVQFPAE
jgi:three-Cys-motif partner protein